MDKKEIIRTIYLYLFSTIGLLLMVIGSVNLVDLGLKNYVFKKANQSVIYPVYPRLPEPTPANEPTKEEQQAFQKKQLEAEQQQKQVENARRASNAIAMIIVGLPLFIYHWDILQNPGKKQKINPVRNSQQNV
ncbi:MAG: hypothetical protein AB1721_02375 [Patescibacteria group bacterium]